MRRILTTIKEKWPEYLLEIIVLIIGIYGAFTLDNWNEERKRSTFEKETLRQILINLNKDHDALSTIHTNFQHAFQSTEKILAIHPDKEQDSLKYWLATIVRFDRFQPLTNAYEVLKSKGLDNLTNKQLIFKLGKYYDDEAQHAIKTVGDVELSFNNDWLPVLREEVIDFEYRKHLILSDRSIITRNGKVRKILILNKDNYRTGIQRISQVLSNLEVLIQEISRELE